MKVKSAMIKKVVILKKTDTLQKTIRKLVKHGISGAPVVNNKKEVIGMVTENDITKMIDAYSHSIKFDTDRTFGIILAAIKGTNEFKAIKKGIKSTKIKVKDFMNIPVIVIDGNRDIMVAARMMHKYKVNRIPVIDKDNKIIGIISRADIIKALAK